MRWASVHDASRGRRIGAASAELTPNSPAWPLVRWSCALAAWARIVSAPANTAARSGLMRVERAGAGEALELAPVEQARVDARGEILEARERPSPLALLDQRLHRLLADALESAERIADAHRLSTVKCAWLALMSGGRHSTPPRRMSSTNIASLSVSAMSKLIDAA